MNDKSKKITVEISPGELLDKISILEIKIEKIKDKNKLAEIEKEYKILKTSKKMQIDQINEHRQINDLFISLQNQNNNGV